MKNKQFTKFELARLRRTAHNVDGFLKQKNRLEAKKAEIEEQLKVINEQIELTDAPTVAMTGYHTEDIIKKVVTPTDQIDKNGNVVKKVTFEFIYPKTIVPVDTEDILKSEAVDTETTTENSVSEDTEETIEEIITE